MATSTKFPNFVRNDHGVDLLDALLAPLFVASSLVMGGLATIGIDAPVAFYLDDVLYAAEGTEITWAFIFTMSVLVIAWVSNEARDLDDFSQEQLAVVAGMVVMNLFAAIVPAVESAMSSYWYAGLLLVMLNGAGYYLIAYY